MKIIADENIPFVKECLSSLGEVVTCSGARMTKELLADADVLLVRSVTKVGAGLLEGSRVQFVATATIGTEHVDQRYLEENNIAFASAPGSNANSVAEYIVAALLAMAKKHKFQLEGKSIGVIGVGNVGSRVAKKTAALGMNVLLNDPPLKRQTGDSKYQPLEKLFGCDFITMHTPLTFDGPDKTHHLAGEQFFKSLGPETFFINTSRGPVADTQALKDALGQGWIKGAVLDVWENEPDIDNELILKAELSTPHIAGYSFDGKVAGMVMIYDALCRHLGIEPQHTAADFLPPPDTAKIEIDPGSDTEQNILQQCVQQVYVINRDDFNTREILIVDEGQRGQWFRDLRKNYPVRREFYNTTVILPEGQGGLAKKLEGIGFKV